MSTFKGTPGPWKFERVKLRSPGSPTFIEVVAADGPVLPWSAFDRTDRSKRENSHNARLIAAAPELLEALRPLAALDLTADDFDQRPDDQPIYARNKSTITVGDVRRAAAAIAKATGGPA